MEKPVIQKGGKNAENRKGWYRNRNTHAIQQLIEYLKNIIFSEKFRSLHKKSSKDFVRTRLLPFHELIFFLMNMNNKSYQDELDRYFQAINHLDAPERGCFQR